MSWQRSRSFTIIEKREPRGLFLYDTGVEIVGVDNLTGDAWTEEFPDHEECVDWLLSPEKEVKG